MSRYPPRERERERARRGGPVFDRTYLFSNRSFDRKIRRRGRHPRSYRQRGIRSNNVTKRTCPTKKRHKSLKGGLEATGRERERERGLRTNAFGESMPSEGTFVRTYCCIDGYALFDDGVRTVLFFVVHSILTI